MMRGSLSAELLKLRKRPTTWVLLGVSLVLTELFAYFLPYTSYVTGDQNQQTQGVAPQQVLAGILPDQLVTNSIGGFPVFAGALALIFGALAAGSEYGWGTLKATLTQRPSRLRLYGGKLLALATIVLAAVLTIFATCAGIASGWLILAMWCLFGALLGFAFRSVALPVGLGVVWVLGVENLISSVAESLLTGLQPLRDLLPAANAGSLVWALAPGGGADGEAPPGVIDAVTGTQATVALALYVAVFVVAGALLLRRRDVT